MEKANTVGWMVPYMKVILKKISGMEQAQLHGLTVSHIREIIFRTKGPDRESTVGLMEQLIQVHSSMGKDMEQVLLHRQAEQSIKAIGLTT